MWPWLDTAAGDTRYYMIHLSRNYRLEEAQKGGRIWTVLVDFEHKNRKLTF